MKHHQKQIHIAHVDSHNNELSQVERWKAHKEGVLHRAFTVGIFYKDFLICQIRRHRVFNGFMDLTSSSHQAYKNGVLEDDIDAVCTTLEREWNIQRSDLIGSLQKKGEVLYKASDGLYIEHEICYLYSGEITTLPTFDTEYAYGFVLLTVEKLKNLQAPLNHLVAPWVQAFLHKKLL